MHTLDISQYSTNGKGLRLIAPDNLPPEYGCCIAEQKPGRSTNRELFSVQYSGRHTVLSAL
jgi:hypothetical protein